METVETVRTYCAWCHQEVEAVHEEANSPWLCRECHHSFESEGMRSLHPDDEREPHNC